MSTGTKGSKFPYRNHQWLVDEDASTTPTGIQYWQQYHSINENRIKKDFPLISDN